MGQPLEGVVASRGEGLSAVLFDWGGTLSHYLGSAPRECLDLAAREIFPCSVSTRFADSLALLIENSWRAGSTAADTFETLTADALRAIVSRVDASTLGPRFVRRFLSLLAAKVRHDEAAVDVLTRLENAKLQRAMVCNTIWPAGWHDQLLRRDGLLDLLPIRSYSSHTHLRKPHPEAFLSMVRRLGLDASSCIFVGDRGDEDIAGAAALGMGTVWVRNSYSPPHQYTPDYIIDSLHELTSRTDRRT